MVRANFVLTMVSGLALAACSQSDGGSKPAEEGAAATANAATGSASAANGSSWNGGAAKPLEIQVAHPNGVVLQVTSIQSRPTDTAVGVRVMNGRTQEVDLNRFPNNRNSFLLLESGERLYLSPPVSNARLTVPAGQTFEGELVFLGRLPPVRSGVMVLNEQASGDSQYSTSPGFRIDLPLAEAAK
jgi:hypothetical protein